MARFTKIPKSSLEGLRAAAVPRKRRFGEAKDTHYGYLGRQGREVAEYNWSGFVLATLLPYLEEKHQIDLMKSEYEELGNFLAQTRKATHFIFTDA